MTRLIIGPFNRVEGDLEVRLDVSDGAVQRAEVVSPLYRGFETMLVGKAPADALVYVPRICGICSVSQSVAAARALAQAQGITPAANGELSMNIIHAVENIADHLTHFYLFFMPDFTRDSYRDRPWHEATHARFAAVRGTATADVLPARAAFLNTLGILAGKWPHTLSIRPGGSTRAIAAHEKARLSAILLAFRRFLERQLFGDRLETVRDLSSAEELDRWRHGRGPAQADFGQFLEIAEAEDLAAFGRAEGRFLSVGAYSLADKPLFAAGIHDGALQSFDPAMVTEDVSHAWYEQDGIARPPFSGETKPEMNAAGYSWCKAPRLSGRPAEVGALARLMVDGQPLIRDLVAGGKGRTGGGSVKTRVVARAVEIALTTLALEGWVAALDPAARFIEPEKPLPSGRGIGLTEAARGALGHWLDIAQGRISSYQIIAPTTWNFSPRDAAGQAGPLEKALEGLPVEGPDSVLVQHVVRSFDPCMVCTVH